MNRVNTPMNVLITEIGHRLHPALEQRRTEMIGTGEHRQQRPRRTVHLDRRGAGLTDDVLDAIVDAHHPQQSRAPGITRRPRPQLVDRPHPPA